MFTTSILIPFAVGFVLGYGLRAYKSWRRRQKALRAYP